MSRWFVPLTISMILANGLMAIVENTWRMPFALYVGAWGILTVIILLLTRMIYQQEGVGRQMDETFHCEKCGAEIPRPAPGSDAWRTVHYLLFNRFDLFGSGVRADGHGAHVYLCDAHAKELARWLRNQEEDVSDAG